MLDFNQNDTVALLGFGRANRAAAAWLTARGLCPTVYDDRTPDPELRRSWEARGIRFGGVLPTQLRERVILRSPVLRPDLPAIAAAVSGGARLVGEWELAMALSKAPVVGVTGSDGKTTTANLTAALLRETGKQVLLGGNNGVPLLGEIEALPKAGAAVMELSSFQLMTVTAPPSVAIITNVTPNHLDWHRGMEEYISAKCRIFDARTHLVLNGENAVTRELALRRLRAGAVGTTVLFSPSEEALPSVPDAVFTRGGRIVLRRNGAEHVLDCLGDLRLAGRHNLENLLAALAAADAIAPLTEEMASTALRGFAGVPHRLESVGNVGGVAYINSSIDTSPTRTAAALAALCCRPLVIAGGRGKGVSLAPLGESLVRHAKGVFLYGEAGVEIEAAIGGRVPTERFLYFDDAFGAASNAAQAGDTVLLSPGCTAFGEFRDFEARGERFRQLARMLPLHGK